MLKTPPFRVVVGSCLLLLAAGSRFARAQKAEEVPEFRIGTVTLRVTADQKEKLRAVESRHTDAIRAVTDRLHAAALRVADADAEEKAIQAEFTVLRAAVWPEVESILTPDQLRQFRDARRESLRKSLQERAERDASYLGAVPAYLQAAAKAERLTLYEGLPHQRSEKLLLEKEIKTKKTIVLSDFRFYAEPLPGREQDLAPFLKLMSDYRSFHAYSEPTNCSGYHPDWCLEWTVGSDEETYRLHICLGCHEAHFVGPRGDLWVRIESPAYEQFLALLKPYAKNRPKWGGN